MKYTKPHLTEHAHLKNITFSRDDPPVNWPKGVPLPTYEEAQEAVRKVGKQIEQYKKEDSKKLPPMSGDDTRRIIRR